MSTSLQLPSTLAQQLWPAHRSGLLRAVIFAALGAALLTLSAKVKVPFYPVPMTMQPFVVIALGLALGSRLAIAAVALYLAQGALGLPVFTDTPARGIGLAYMMGPTGGFLAGFVLAAGTVGLLADRGWSRGIATGLLAALAGVALIYAPGVAYLATLIGWDKAITLGAMPFIFKDIVAATLAAFVVGGAWRVFGRGA